MKMFKYYFKVKEYKDGILKEVKGNLISIDNKDTVLMNLNNKHYNKYTITKKVCLN
jgi:hypothetical protein